MDQVDFPPYARFTNIWMMMELHICIIFMVTTKDATCGWMEINKKRTTNCAFQKVRLIYLKKMLDRRLNKGLKRYTLCAGNSFIILIPTRRSAMLSSRLFSSFRLCCHLGLFLSQFSFHLIFFLGASRQPSFLLIPRCVTCLMLLYAN